MQEREIIFNMDYEENQLEQYKEYPDFFKKIINLRMHPCLFTSFTKRYLLKESDGILIMIEYFKFLTLIYECGDGLTPSPWIDEFWRHHIAFDTKHYRDFCNSLFGNQIHYKYETPSSDKIKLVKAEINSTTFTINCYIEVFGYPPPECIWPDMSNYDSKINFSFVHLNIFKTMITKTVVKDCNDEFLSNPENIDKLININKGSPINVPIN